MSITVAFPVRSPVQAATKCADKPRSARRVGRALSFKKKSRKPSTQRKSRVLFHYTKEELEPFFHISQKEAAKQLGIAVITLKRICKRGKFNWPYRANKTKEIQERNSAAETPVRRASAKTKAGKKSKTGRQAAIQHKKKATSSRRRAVDRAFADETRATQEAMRLALQSLALCAVKIEQDEIERANMTAAAMTFSQLPLLCMLENEDTIML